MKIHEILPLCIVLFASGCVSGIQINKHKLYPIFTVFSADRKMVVTHLRKFSDFISSIMLVAMKRNQMETSFVVLWSFLPGCILRRLPKISVAYVSVREGPAINIGGALFVKIPHKSVNFLPGVLPFGVEAVRWLLLFCKKHDHDLVLGPKLL